MDKDFKKEFNQCPCCNSDQRFCEQLAQELKDRGIAKPDWKFNYAVSQGVAVEKEVAAKLPIGSELPGYVIITDICMDCGTIYAKSLSRHSVTISQDMTPPRPTRPSGLPDFKIQPYNRRN